MLNISGNSQTEKLEPLFVFIDEANPLLESSNTENHNNIKLNKFKLMRRAITTQTREMPIAFTIASTNNQLSKFVSNKFTLSESERLSLENNKPPYSPFYKTLYIDHMVPDDYFKNLQKSVYSNLILRDPFVGLFLLGRPLWASMLSEEKNSRTDILNYVCRKIQCADNWKHVESKSAAALAMFSIRTTLSVDYRVIESADLIARHLATLYFVSKDNTECAFTYFSEPILAEGK